MKLWAEDFQKICKQKYYLPVLFIAAILGYGFLITHQRVGIDDTLAVLYFEDGLTVVMGRWVLFLLNKVFSIAEFSPFVTELASVLIFLGAVTLFCTLWKRIFGNRIPDWGYLLFSCLFLSNPLHSEVFTYYLHNGTALGYLACGISLCFFWEGVLRLEKGKINRSIVGTALGSVFFLWIAIGCYESFMIVYLVGVCMALCSARMCGKIKVLPGLIQAFFIILAGMVLRSLMVSLLTWIFDLASLKEIAGQRSLSEILWIWEPGTFSRFAMILKRLFVMYGVFAYAYYPIAIYLAASVVVVLVCIWRAISRKDAWIPVLGVFCFIASFLLIFIEGKVTLYRSAQFLPLFSSWGLLLLVFAFNRWKNRILNIGLGAVLVIILWNQCADMNKWFYVDYLKYEDAKNTMNQVAYTLEKDFDTSKPIVFTGSYPVPRTIVEDAYVPYNSETFYKMNRLTGLVDKHLLEKYYREYGVWVAQTPALSVLDWGKQAFATNEALTIFFSMHGHELRPQLDFEVFLPAELSALSLPSFPKDGSIVDMGEYIIVNF